MRFLFFLMLMMGSPAVAGEVGPPPVVLASIAPLAGIAAAVMEGVGAPDLLIRGNASPHTYQLRPNDAVRLERADLVLWVGEGLETFLAQPLAVLGSRAQIVELADEPGLLHLPGRAGGVWEPEDEDEDEDEDSGAHDEHHAHHDHGANDPHLWLDPDNAIAIASLLADRLAALDPAHARRYKSNAAAFSLKIRTQDAAVRKQLEPLAVRGFIVFHDAYQYFERHYGLRGAGSITISPEQAPSAARLAELRERVASGAVACVLAEPQFSDTLAATLVAGSSARAGVVNPDASDLPVSPDLYPVYLQRLADDFTRCLASD